MNWKEGFIESVKKCKEYDCISGATPKKVGSTKIQLKKVMRTDL